MWFYGLAVAAGLAALVSILITASIVNDLFLRRPPAAARAAALSPADILACNREVRGLLEGLVLEASRLAQAPLGSDEALGASWDEFEGRWDEAWNGLETRCRFSELADQGLGTAYDRTAWVYRSLPRARLQYKEWMARFSRDLRIEIAEMRRALDKSQADLGTPGAGQGHAQ